MRTCTFGAGRSRLTGAWLLWALLWLAPCAYADDSLVLHIDIDGPIGPATADFVVKSLQVAEEQNVELVLIRMDTPGGLDLSTRDIVKGILNSPVPVATFVAPEGARAASAGTFILYASHVAAMSPATNVGAATPVSMIGGQQPGKSPLGGDSEPPKREAEPPEKSPGDADGETAGTSGEEGADEPPPKASPKPAETPADAMGRKALNDTVAYVRGLAGRHGRNVDWAELAVREAASITAEKALEIGVIDVMARDIPDLLEQIDGRIVALANGERTLNTAAVRVEQRLPDWKTRLLGVITSPTIAYLLLLVGVYGLILEGYNPGAILPGAVGAISLLLALYALQLLPVNYVGFGLIALGIILMIAEALAPSFGVLGIGGVVALVIGSVILIDTDAPGFVVSRPLIAAIALVSALGLMAIMAFAVKARQRPVVAGAEELIGSTGQVLDDFDGAGFVFVHGERWGARCAVPLRAGQAVTVTGIDGLILQVRPAVAEMPGQPLQEN